MSPTSCLRRARLLIKSTALVVTVAYLGLYLQPLAIAAQLPPSTAPAPLTNEGKLNRHLAAIEDGLAALEGKLDRAEDASTEQTALATLRQELDGLDTQAINDYTAIGQRLADKNLPALIRDRHAEAVRIYGEEMAILKANLDAIEAAADNSARKTKVQQARDHLKLKHGKRAQPGFDPKQLPNKNLQPDRTLKPKLLKEDYLSAGLTSNPRVQLAALGDFTFDKLPGASDPAYLAATSEVVLTDAIRAKAAELHHNPVEIYTFVRNSVEWLPTWGATQDAEVTLGSLRGNAFDIASLTLALLRASGIPARYVHGTIEVPEDKFRNWAGGFTSITGAADYAASGGIPVTTVISGGRITKVRLEHIWVEAATDFHPSRGAVNKAADKWVALDASYKQYEYLEGLDAVAIAGLDPATLAESFAASGTVNATEGYVQNLNPAVLQTAQTQAQGALESYITSNLPNATVGDVIGGRKIIARASSVLPTSLPNRTTVIGARYGTIPESLQHRMTLAFAADLQGEPTGGITLPWSKLNNHQVSLSFKPATSADEQTLAALLPEGEITDPSQLPASIPAYLISVIPEITLDGTVIAQGSAMRLGEDLNFSYGIERVNGHGSHVYSYPLPAGSYVSVAIAGGSVSPTKLNALQTKLTETKTILESGNSTAIGALTREDILGDMFEAGTLGYFGQYIALAHISSLAQKATHNLPSAYGTLGYEPNVERFFGLPRAITPGGVAVNVRLQWVVHSQDGNATKRPQLSLQTGLLSSALEHVIPEQMFSTPTQPAEAVSAAKALQIAQTQGQRVYHITQSNQATALPNLHLDDLATQEITTALATGKEVIAHTDPISVPGWTGAGYIIFDPVTGDGAYKISGGGNGGFLFWVTVLFLATMFSIALLGGSFIGAFLTILAYNGFLDRVQKIAQSNLTASQLPAALRDAAFLAVIGTLGGQTLGALGNFGAVAIWLLRGLLLSFGAVWYG